MTVPGRYGMMIVLGRLCGDAPFLLEPGYPPAWSAGWCSAQRIKNPMIAGGNHTLIQVTPALQPPSQPGIKKELPPQPDPTHDLNSTHAPITIWLWALPRENDPWRFRQQSSRVISIQFWYLTSLFTSLSIGSDPFVLHNGYCKTCIF